MTAHSKELIGLLEDFKNDIINKFTSPLYSKITAQQIVEDVFSEYEAAIIESED